MSNPPPPPPPPPSNQPGGVPGAPPASPGPIAGGPPAAPSWQQTAVPTAASGLTPNPGGPAKKSKLPLIIGAIVVLGIIAAVLVFVLGGDDDDAGGIDAAGAHDGLETVIEDASFDDSGNDDFRDCPLGDLDQLTATVTNAIDLDEAVGQGTDESSVTEESGDLPAFVSCQYFVEDESEVASGATSVFFQGIYEPPSDYEEYITQFAGDITDVEFEDPVEYAGGTIYRFCATAADEAGFTGCDADWVDDDEQIALNVFLGGDDADADDAETALKSVLETMATSLAALQPAG